MSEPLFEWDVTPNPLNAFNTSAQEAIQLGLEVTALGHHHVYLQWQAPVPVALQHTLVFGSLQHPQAVLALTSLSRVGLTPSASQWILAQGQLQQGTLSLGHQQAFVVHLPSPAQGLPAPSGPSPSGNWQMIPEPPPLTYETLDPDLAPDAPAEMALESALSSYQVPTFNEEDAEELALERALEEPVPQENETDLASPYEGPFMDSFFGVSEDLKDDDANDDTGNTASDLTPLLPETGHEDELFKPPAFDFGLLKEDAPPSNTELPASIHLPQGMPVAQQTNSEGLTLEGPVLAVDWQEPFDFGAGFIPLPQPGIIDWPQGPSQTTTANAPAPTPFTEALDAKQPFALPSLPIPTPTSGQDSVDPMAPYQSGQRVQHPAYGAGVVENVLDVQGRTVLRVRFDTMGKRLLDANLTQQLTVLE